MGSDSGRHPTGSEFVRVPGPAAPQPFGPPVNTPPISEAPAGPGAPNWAIDPDAIQRALGTTTRRTVAPRGGTRRRRLTGAFALVAVGAAGAGIAVAVTAGSRGEPGTATAAATTVSATSAPVAAPESRDVPVVPLPGPQRLPSDAQCAPAADESVVIGNGPGGTDTGTSAILGFEYAYYTARDGERAQEFVAADTVNVAGAEGLQQAIDTAIPPGTTHCVHIVPREPELFDVDIDEYRPGGERLTYRQTIRTVVRDGRTLLYEIRDRAQ